MEGRPILPPYFVTVSTVYNCFNTLLIISMKRYFKVIFVRYQDRNTPVIIMVLGCSKWLGVRLEVLCSLLVTLVTAGAVLVTQIPGLIPWLANFT